MLEIIIHRDSECLFKHGIYCLVESHCKGSDSSECPFNRDDGRVIFRRESEDECIERMDRELNEDADAIEGGEA